MPHHQHRHLHDRRDIGDEFDRWMDKMNPFKDNGGGGGNNNNGKVQRDDGDDGTLVRTVYKTMEPTFKGPVAGYSTIGQQAKDTPTQRPPPPPPSSAPTPKPEPKTTPTEENKTQPPTTTPQEHTKSTPMPSVIPNTSLSSVDSVIAKATVDPSSTRATRLGDGQPSSTLGVPSPSSTADSSKGDQGPSTGAKAGIAFGVLGGLLVVGLLVFFLFNRRRKAATEREQLDDDEKHHFGAAPAPSPTPFEPASASQADPKAPRISLRPVTQFLPNWNGLDNKRSSKGAGMMLGGAAAGAAAGASARAVGGSAWERPGTSQSTNPANPFGNQAERVPSPIKEERSHGRASPSPVNGSVNGSGPTTPRSVSPPSPVDPLTANGPVIAAAAAGTAVGAGAAAGLARKTSMRNGGPKNIDLTLPHHPGTIPPSPAGTEFSVSSVAPGTAAPASSGAAAIAAAGGPQNSAVHRVQLDFQPTLEDEMGLKAGELVRLLHEYDDGWALVIRLDRSQQGVVPRTCLSTRPVKPRPPPGAARPGPPVNPNGRPRGPSVSNGQRSMAPQGMPHGGRPGRPESPSHPRMGPPGPGPRPASPAGYGGRPQSPMGTGRPMSPGPRAQSPGPRQGPSGTPQSPNSSARRVSPLGPSPMNPQSSPQEPMSPGSSSGPPAGPVGRKPVPGQAY
ncbi:hypothetical protein JDV02_007820 [Purpureocillium takamizusanense]|uniref:SH3 domain-containing protein n=1 Tax=Purpureocillium takamizusanense TaxID=2060973 RepID=A0A9Q8QLL3_9HYPO|nr:uncharacterized protein JDV02_007820 [Purpureocillium takamizusanense]UNI21870.1 hypothetical protein JDV02_007820 [Purpureocillium takamizusanense]